MKKWILYLVISVCSFDLTFAQIDADGLIGIPTATDLAAITAITGPQIGSIVYNLDDDQIYRFTSTGWQVNTDDQTASEVIADTPLDVDGDGANEITLEDVIQDILPITSKSARIFYPPSIAIDASTISSNIAAPGDETVDLYQQYIDQFTLNNAATSASSTGAPGTIPTYAANELYYYVTFFDPLVFANVTIDANGVMAYDIIGTPPDYNSLINVVFVVR